MTNLPLSTDPLKDPTSNGKIESLLLNFFSNFINYILNMLILYSLLYAVNAACIERAFSIRGFQSWELFQNLHQNTTIIVTRDFEEKII